MPPADLKLVQQVLLVFVDATGRDWALLFSLPLVLRGWGPGLGHTIQFPALGPGLLWAARLKSATQLLSAWVNLCHRVWDKQGAQFPSNAVSGHTLLQTNGVHCGELFQVWEIWLSPHLEKPVGSKFGGQDPCPWIGSPVGNQACIVPWLLWDLLLLKLPHAEAAYVYWVSLSSQNLG